MQMTPMPLISQAIRALAPSGASATGSMKMPEPMIVPTTSALVIQMPIVCGLPDVAPFAAPPDLARPTSRPSPRANAKRTGAMMRAFIFPGQGSQAVGMGAALAEASRTARDTFAEVDEALGQNLFKLMRDGPEDELQADRKCAAGDHGAFAGGVPRADPGRRGRSGQGRAASSPATASANIRPCARRARSTSRPPPSCSSCAARRCRPRCRSGRARWRRCSAPTSSWRSGSPMPPPRARCAPSPMTMIPGRW